MFQSVSSHGRKSWDTSGREFRQDGRAEEMKKIKGDEKCTKARRLDQIRKGGQEKGDGDKRQRGPACAHSCCIFTLSTYLSQCVSSTLVSKLACDASIDLFF